MNGAVIVDTRPISREVIDRHLDYLPGWELVGFIQPNSLEVFREYNAKAFIASRINNGADYNRLLTTPSFWEKLLKYDKVLIFQADSGLLRKGIDEFLDYDYVGAPWKANAPWARADRAGGNGGLSIRSPKNSLNLLLKKPYNPSYGNEDVYFTHNLSNVAPYETCRKFSVETEFQLDTLGWHAIDKHLTSTEVSKILQQYD
jgi:hypothetical protein